jgi:hypothetical protein
MENNIQSENIARTNYGNGELAAIAASENGKRPNSEKEEFSAPLPASNAQPGEPEKKKRTLGNKIYDFGVFGSIAWLGVSAVSALTAHEAMYGKNKYFNWMRKTNTWIFEGLKNVLSKSVMKNSTEEKIKEVAKDTTMVFTLGMGGHTLMAPIKWLEDNRQSNAAKIDKFLGTTPPDEKAIAEEPKQSWKSVFSGRMLSWGAAFATVLAIPKTMHEASKKCGEKGAEIWMKLRPKSNVKSVNRWSDLIAFDLLFTIVTAGVTYGFSRFVAGKDDKKPEPGDKLYQLNPIAPNPLGDDILPDKNKKKFADSIKPERKALKEPVGTFLDKVNSDSNLGHVRA